MSETQLLGSLRISGSNFDVDGAQEQHGGRVINYGFWHMTAGASAYGFTAHAGGGQGSATTLGLGISVVTTVATDHNSVILPAGAVIGGCWQTVVNNGAHILDIYPQLGGNINGLGVNAALSIPPGGVATLVSNDDGSGGLNYTASVAYEGAIPDAGLSSTFVHLGGSVNETVTGTKTFTGQIIPQGTTSAIHNTSVGSGALGTASGDGNTAIGTSAGVNVSSGTDNTAVGYFAGAGITTGGYNVAIGYQSLNTSNTATNNVAVGANALYGLNAAGGNNVAVGYGALAAATTISDTTAVGYQALSSLVSNAFSTAVGYQALNADTAGYNTALGTNAGKGVSSGTGNTAVGINTLNTANTAANNTAIGYYALQGVNGSGGNNTVVGYEAGYNITTGATNTALGYQAGWLTTTGSNNIHIANPGIAAETAVIKIGVQGTQTSTTIAGISGQTSSGAPVYVDATGKLGTRGSTSAQTGIWYLEDYGGKADNGTTDNATPWANLMAAMDTAYPTGAGGIVQLGPGTYYTTQTWRIRHLITQRRGWQRLVPINLRQQPGGRQHDSRRQLLQLASRGAPW